MRILELCQDYKVPHVTEGHKHVRPGWVNIECPFCTGNPGYHLGYNLDGNYFHCWRCGGKRADRVIAKILSIGLKQARNLIREYGGVSRVAKKVKPKVRIKTFQYPSGDLHLKDHHRRYLAKRGYDPDYLEEHWNLMGTGPTSFLDGINYSHRIMAPIFWGNQIVSFQTRALNNSSDLKYLACPKAREIIEHQHVLYGNPYQWNDRGVCVEGIFDVWRLKDQSFAVFGIDYTSFQVREISSRFKEVVVLFDPDPQAIKQANRLVAELKFRGVKAWREDIETDPGDMSQSEADYLMKQLLK